MPAVTKVEVQDYTDTLVRIVVERGEEAPLAVIFGKSELPSPSVRDGKLSRPRGDMDAAVRARVAEAGREPIPDELAIAYEPSLRVEAEPEKAPPRR